MFKKIKHIHFVGIGGIGMSGIAEVLLNLEYRVSGSDLKESDTTERLRKLGGEIFIGHRAENVNSPHVVVISSAVKKDNVEVAAAREQQVPVIPRAEMLAELMRLKYGIAIAGAHGKTTTTSMVATVLAAGGIDPTVVIGGKLNSIGSNAKLGQGEFLVAEADESDGSFLRLSPTIAVVTNIDEEHLDYYKDIDEIKAAFLTFINKVPFYGVAVLCLDESHIQSLIPHVQKRYQTYGTSTQADYQARDITLKAMGSRFRVMHLDRDLGWFELNVPGMHNVSNSLAAIAVARELEMDEEVIRKAINEFGGVHRRFQIKGEERGVTVIDDYGHHPTEIRATLAAAKAGPERRVVAVFQPHRYTRTQHLLEGFSTAFNQADTVVLMDIYAAGEQPIPGVTGQAVYDGIKRHGHKDVTFIPDRDRAVAHLAGAVREGDLLITLGAGDVWKIGEQLLERLRTRREQK
ncbi:MAG: UDP-N-acetylmuramate--L-alanine ligase [Nitrospirae bacterium GWC2_57_13]|nr:MAG: UDP-N-acetylmuramate--L-alanine ligase [Nitrospirae bacterium GWC1_57_7]OGW27235.1 MAG: UDP-N-acetylmuramate--L-alanine ligase [Nitrospirae bacterium GWC2_57_13]OGW45778.1 MAG: UDP-N-acetylmuramate--L-alanine ligase [Nitrospirae bacterium GWD2_57_8]HAR45141.1 UDP-N-acetylmuramate--L-alanine ligase [Nitrospiraceae bacterium]